MNVNYLDIIHARICPYCGGVPVLTDSAEIYNGRSYGPVYLCRKCDAFVGCHDGTVTPKGRLADRALREAKKQAHEAFDSLWRAGQMKRKEAYAWLSASMGTLPEYTHIGMFDIWQCREVIRLCENFR